MPLCAFHNLIHCPKFPRLYIWLCCGPGPGSFISPSLCIGPSSAAYSLVLTIIIYYHYLWLWSFLQYHYYCHYCCCGCRCCSCSCYQSYVVLPALASSLVHLLRFYDFVFKQLSAQDPRRSPSRTSCVSHTGKIRIQQQRVSCILLFAGKWSLFTDSWILFESMLIPRKELTKLSLLCGGRAIHASGLSLGPWLWGLLRGFPFLFLFRLRVALVCDRTASCSHDSIQHSITKALGRHWNCNETYTHLSQ